MPFIYDFNNAVGETRDVEIYPRGWKSPIIVEYVVAQAHKYDTMLSIVWRIKGTSHCFTIAEQRLNVLSHGDYKKHFTEALEAFRKDYLSWFTEKEYEKCDWKYEYQSQFGKLIIEDAENNSNKN